MGVGCMDVKNYNKRKGVMGGWENKFLFFCFFLREKVL